MNKMETYIVSSEELGIFNIKVKAKNLREAEKKVIELIDIHNINEFDE